MPTKPIPIRLSESDQAALREVAMRLQRNGPETVRLLIRETWAVIQEGELKAGADQQQPQPAK